MATKTLQGDKVIRLNARIRVVQGATRMALMMFCMAVGFVVVATAIPQRKETLLLERKLSKAVDQESAIVRVKEQRKIELQALREDPEYLEIHARDRLDVCLEGETVFRFRKN